MRNALLIAAGLLAIGGAAPAVGQDAVSKPATAKPSITEQITAAQDEAVAIFRRCKAVGVEATFSAENLARMFTPDAVVIMPGAAPAKGVEAIGTMLREIGCVDDFSSKVYEVKGGGLLASSIFTTEFTTAQGKQRLHEALVWRKGRDKVWRVQHNVLTPAP
jgi:ketosteroid isomerase-like protein